MKRTAKWMRKLTIKEINHIKWLGGIRALKTQLQNDKGKEWCDCCGECRTIGHKLGFEV